MAATRGWMMDTMWSVRQMGRAPLMSLVIVSVLAVGLSTNAALFAYIDHQVRRPTEGLDRPQELHEVRFNRAENRLSLFVDFAEFRAFEELQGAFASLAASTVKSVVLDLDGSPVTGQAEFVSDAFFRTLRPDMALGTWLTEPGRPDDGVTAVISYPFWQANFGSADVRGRVIRVDRNPVTIAGVLGKDYSPAAPILISLSAAIGQNGWAHVGRGSTVNIGEGRALISGGIIAVIGRTTGDMTLQQATSQASIAAVAAGERIGARDPFTGVSIKPLRSVAYSNIAESLPVLGALTTTILLISCATVAILLLGRAVSRQREIGVRLAIGAGRLRIVRQLMTEGVLLGILASVPALLIVPGIGQLIQSLFSDFADLRLTLSLLTIASTIGLGIATGVVFALAPALHATGSSISAAMRDGSVTGAPSRNRLQSLFVIAEVALGVALVCCAGALALAALEYSKSRMGEADLTARTVLVTLQPGMSGYSAERVEELSRELIASVAAVQGIEAVSTSDALPGESRSFAIPSAPAASQGGRGSHAIPMNRIEPGFLSLAGVGVIQGRDFTPMDSYGVEPVVIIDSSIAEKMFSGRDPIGQTFEFEVIQDSDGTRTLVSPRIIGVASGESGSIFVPRSQQPATGPLVLAARVASESTVPVGRIMLEEARRLDPDLPVSSVRTLQEHQALAIEEARGAGVLATAFGFAALALACVGVYAVVSFNLEQRSRELAIRRALGATELNVTGLFFRHGMRLVVIGFVIGIPLAFAAMWISQANVVGVRLINPFGMAAIICVLFGIGVLATWLPARRARVVDPIHALRAQ